jgi:TPR repeat protein
MMLRRCSLTGLVLSCLSLLAVAVVAPGCGSRPGYTAAAALGGASVPAVSGPSKPLVVDWKPDQRADLEEVIHDGVAIVSWKDDGLRLLRTCTIQGNYGYIGVQTKKEVVRLASSEEIAANLPLGGLGIAGKLGGQLQHGATLDIAYAIVGKRRTTWNSVSSKDLAGDCSGATHFVRAVLVGAFAMAIGDQTKTAAAAAIFGVGASGGTDDSKNLTSADGRLEDCEQAGADDPGPPKQCAAIVRLELEPVSKGETRKPAADSKAAQTIRSDVTEGCPPGFVLAAGSCKRPSADLAYACSGNDPQECLQQCNKGNAQSCNRLGVAVLRDGGEVAVARKAFARACDADDAEGCKNLGLALGRDDSRGGLEAFSKACLLGYADSCLAMGEALAEANRYVMAARVYKRGCEAGSYLACSKGAYLYSAGQGDAVPRDDALALQMFVRSCNGGQAVDCGNAGLKFEFGEAVRADVHTAEALYQHACSLEDAECYRLGMLDAVGADGLSKNDERGETALELSCAQATDTGSLACVVGKALYHAHARGAPDPKGLQQVAASMKAQCQSNEPRACTYIGIAQYGLGQKALAQKTLARACSLNDALACQLKASLR